MPPVSIHHLITSLQGGGTEYFLWQMLRHAPAGLQQEVFFLKKDGIFGQRIRALGIPVQQISIPALFLRWKKQRPDILHTCLFRAHQVGRVLGQWSGIPRIVSSQRSIDGWASDWHQRLDAWTLHRCHRVIVNSHAAQRVVEKRLNGRTTPDIRHLPNAMDPDMPTRSDRAQVRHQLGLPVQAVVAGTLMRLHPEKGADQLLPLADVLLKRYPDLHLAIGGTGPLEKDLRRQSTDKPYASRLHWLGWVHQTSGFLSAIDRYIALSREESFSQALLEASALNVPWVSTPVGGVDELLEAGAAGREYRSFEQLAEEWNQPFPASRLDLQRFDAQDVSRRFYSLLSGGEG